MQHEQVDAGRRRFPADRCGFPGEIRASAGAIVGDEPRADEHDGLALGDRRERPEEATQPVEALRHLHLVKSTERGGLRADARPAAAVSGPAFPRGDLRERHAIARRDVADLRQGEVELAARRVVQARDAVEPAEHRGVVRRQIDVVGPGRIRVEAHEIVGAEILDEPADRLHRRLRGGGAEAVLVDRDDDQPPRGHQLAGVGRLVLPPGRSGPRALGTEVLHEFDGKHAAPLAVDRDFEVVRTKPRKGVTLLVDDLHVNSEDLHARLDSGRRLRLRGCCADRGDKEGQDRCHCRLQIVD